MADTEALIDLKVLSPSTEVLGDIVLPDIPAPTTVRDLRLRIQNEIASRPSTDRMRLIYRGRVVADESATLIDVFGPDNIRASREQTLHLVLRELPAASTGSSGSYLSSLSPSPAPRSSTAPPDAPRDTQNLAVPQQTNPFRPLVQPRPNSQPQVPHAQPHPQQHHQNQHPTPQPPPNPLGHIPLPPAVNNLLQQQMAQAIAQNNPQNGAPRTQQTTSSTPAPADGGQAAPAGLPIGIGPGANLPPGSTRTIRSETVGPNGERVTVTWNTNITIPGQPHQIPMLPRPFPHPPGFPLSARPSPGPPGDAVDQLLARARAGLQTARQEMDNVRVLLQGPGGLAASTGPNSSVTPPLWRIHQIRQHMQNLGQGLEQVQLGLTSLLTSLTSDPSMEQNRHIVQLQQSANDLRGHAEQVNNMLDRLRNDAASTEASPSLNTASAAAPSSGQSTAIQAPAPQSQSTQSTINAPLADGGPELFILSSPQGPVGILFDQRGTYSTGPVLSTLPFRTFTQQFASNRQVITGISQQIAQNTHQLNNHLAATRPLQNAQPAAGAQPPMDQPAQQNQNQNANQVPNQNPAAENDRLAQWAGHAWLIFKLACFIYIFAGHGGWYRPIMLGIVGALVYLAQVGMFDAQFNQIRQHFEAILPLADQDRQGQNTNGLAQNQGQQRVEPNRNLTPEQAAQRLLRQHQEQNRGWIRQSMRTVERAFALFVASLWPGIGERMVQAQEERARAERAAEEERQRQEEERRQQEEAQKAEQQSQDAAAEQKAELHPDHQHSVEATSSKGKGKEKIEVAEEGPSA